MTNETQHYALRLIPPRPSFSLDMTQTERAIMTEHVDYWRGLLARGVAVAFGPVLDPAGPYGLGIVAASGPDEVRELEVDDPAIASGLCTYEFFPMPGAFVRPVAGGDGS
ncbi:YciI family protein [Micromonospora sp. NPDC049559]|uniref:YciI family protein n=1 Tax=Micromonospora sp. NPDC049559 TaxID=3155923 RepID=UPI0034240712